MSLYYVCVGLLPALITFIGLLMWLIPGKHVSNTMTNTSNTPRQILGILISFCGIICWTAQIAVAKKDTFFYESPSGPVYKVFKIEQTVPTTIHDTVVVNTRDTVVLYFKDSISFTVIQEPLALDTNTIE